jgi:hypothetical protein
MYILRILLKVCSLLSHTKNIYTNILYSTKNKYDLICILLSSVGPVVSKAFSLNSGKYQTNLLVPFKQSKLFCLNITTIPYALNYIFS